MTQFINQNSFLLFAVPVVLLILFFLLRPPGSLLKQVLAIALLAAVVVGFFLARPGRHGTSGEETDALLFEGGRPVLVEIYSPY